MPPRTDSEQDVKAPEQVSEPSPPVAPALKPSIAAASAEGATGYAALNGDKESQRARRFIDRRVSEMRERYAQREPDARADERPRAPERD